MPRDNSGDADENENRGIEIFKGVRVSLTAKLGRAELSIEEVLALTSGSVVELDCSLAGPIELWLNDALVARGSLVAVDDNFGVRITEVLKVGQ